jgi:hypothetical protein
MYFARFYYLVVINEISCYNRLLTAVLTPLLELQAVISGFFYFFLFIYLFFFFLSDLPEKKKTRVCISFS